MGQRMSAVLWPECVPVFERLGSPSVWPTPRLQAALDVLQANLVVAGLQKDAADLLMQRERTSLGTGLLLLLLPPMLPPCCSSCCLPGQR